MKFNWLPVIIVLIAVIGFVYFGGAPQTIVSISQISVKGLGDFVQAEIAVNNAYESVFFIPKENMTTMLSDGSKFEARKNIEVSFRPEEVYCNVPLKAISEPIATGNYVYYVANQEYFRNVPVTYTIKRDSIIIDTGTISVNKFPTVNKTLSDGSEVNITQLGLLDGGYQCPDSSDFAIVETSTGFKIVDKAQLEYRLNNLDLFKVASCFANPLSALSCISDLINLNNIPYPSGYIINTSPDCAPYTSCASNYGVHINELNKSNLRYELPLNAVTPIVIVNMNKKFVDGIIVSAPQGNIDIVSTTLSSSSINYNNTTNLVVVVKNTGTTGDNFTLRAEYNPSIVSVSPSITSVDMPLNATKTINFTVRNINNSDFTEQICISGSTSGQFGGTKTDSSCVNLTGKKVDTGCGLGYELCNANCYPACSIGKIRNVNTCECEDMIPPEECLPTNTSLKCTCEKRPTDFFISGWDYIDAIPLIRGEECKPIYNFGNIMIVFFGGLIILGTGYYFIFIKKGKRRR